MTQLALDMPLADESSYSNNGMIFKNLSQKLKALNMATDDFGEVFLDAIRNKIWLGFLNPRNGRLTSFTQHDGDGNIDHSLSFKMWLSTAPEKGGLGITDLNIIESLLRSNRQAYEATLPLLLDAKAIKQANNIRESQGEPPLLRIGRSKEFYLKKQCEAPPEFAELNHEYKLPLSFTGKCASVYLKSNSEEQIEVIGELRRIKDTCDDKDDLQEKVSELFGVPYFKLSQLNPSDPHQIAEEIWKVSGRDKEKIKAITQQLLLVSEGDED